MSGGPNPSAMPFPIAADPDESRIGRDGDDFDLRWRRHRVGDDDFSLRRSARHGRGLLDINRAVAIDHLAFHAAREKRQRGGY